MADLASNSATGPDLWDRRVGGPICVFGAGAIGGWLAASLASAGEDVSVLARGPQLDAIRRNGLRVRGAECDLRVRLRASDDPRDLGVQSAVVVTVKAHGLAAVAKQIGPLLGPETAVYFLLNGMPWWLVQDLDKIGDDLVLRRLDPGNVLRDAISLGRTIGGVIFAAAEVVAPGKIEIRSARQRIVLGEPSGAISDRVKRMVASLNAGGIEARATEAIGDEVWSKLMANISSGPLCLLTQAPVSEVFADPIGEKIARRLLSEVEAIAKAHGHTPDGDHDGFVRRGRVLHHRPSVLQDLELGRTLEFDALYEAPLALAKMAGVPVPTLEMLVSLARIRIRQAAKSQSGVSCISDVRSP